MYVVLQSVTSDVISLMRKKGSVCSFVVIIQRLRQVFLKNICIVEVFVCLLEWM